MCFTRPIPFKTLAVTLRPMPNQNPILLAERERCEAARRAAYASFQQSTLKKPEA
jgi:hypothetical protein